MSNLPPWFSPDWWAETWTRTGWLLVITLGDLALFLFLIGLLIRVRRN